MESAYFASDPVHTANQIASVGKLITECIEKVLQGKRSNLFHESFQKSEHLLV